MTTRNGKIARLAAEVREELNERLLKGEEGKGLVVWLNGLPEVKDVLAEWFGGRPISEQNLSEWKQGGFMEWEGQRQLLEDVEAADLLGCTLAQGYDGLVNRLLAVLSARYGQLLLRWDGEPDEARERQQRVLRRLSRDVLALQRGQQRAAQLVLAQGRHGWAEHDFKQRVEKEQQRTGMWAQVSEMGKQRTSDIERPTSKGREETLNPGTGSSHVNSPLTPALSPVERGNDSQRVSEVETGTQAEGGAATAGKPVESGSIKPNQTMAGAAAGTGGETSNIEQPTSNAENRERGTQWN